MGLWKLLSQPSVSGRVGFTTFPFLSVGPAAGGRARGWSHFPPRPGKEEKRRRGALLTRIPLSNYTKGAARLYEHKTKSLCGNGQIKPTAHYTAPQASIVFVCIKVLSDMKLYRST